jgi:hypothetical protein
MTCVPRYRLSDLAWPSAHLITEVVYEPQQVVYFAAEARLVARLWRQTMAAAGGKTRDVLA